MLAVLLKKTLTEKLSVFKKDKKRIDVLGALLTLVLAALLIAVCVIVLTRFLNVYLRIRINGVTDIAARQFELLTLIYGALFIVGTLSGIRNINFSLFENEDRNILITLPIKASTVFYSKLITVYLQQVFVSLLTLLPLNFTFAAATGQSAYFIVMTLLMCLLFPIVTLAFSSVLSLPVYFFKTFMKSKYLMSLIVATAVTGLLFWGYSTVLDFVKTLMTTGEIKYFFREETMNAIISLSDSLYPSNVIARVLLKWDTGKNIGILIATVIGAGALGFVVNSLAYNKASQTRVAAERHSRKKQAKPSKLRPQFITLMIKEFDLVFRTPSYAFQYFSVAAVMPLMTYFCMGIGEDLLAALVMGKSNFELAVFLVLMFGTLTNVFCATNISRDGPAFFTLKTMPVRPEKILASKIAFCSIIAFVSTLVTCVLIAALGYINWGESTFVLFVAMLLAEAQICFATRKDLNRPTFSSDEDCEVRESNNTISEIIVAGLLTALILGGVSLYLSVYRGNIMGEDTSSRTMLIVGLSALAVFCASLTYTLVGLKKTFENMTEGG